MEKQQPKPADSFTVVFQTLRTVIIVGMLFYVANKKDFSFTFNITQPNKNYPVQVEADTLKNSNNGKGISSGGNSPG